MGKTERVLRFYLYQIFILFPLVRGGQIAITAETTIGYINGVLLIIGGTLVTIAVCSEAVRYKAIQRGQE